MTEKIIQTLLTSFLTLSTADAAYNEINPSPFAMIENREKTIELRLNDEKRRLINVGDEITFINTEDNRKTLKTEIVNIYKFKSFEELYAVLPLLKCGYTKEDVKTASPEDMLAYYSAKQQEKYGVLGIEIKVIS